MLFVKSLMTMTMMLVIIIYETTVVGAVGRMDIGRGRQTAEVVGAYFAAPEDN